MSDSWDPRKSEHEVTVRRWKRRLKASASVLLAMAAGTYLACQRTTTQDRPRAAPNPTTPEISNLPAPPPAPPDLKPPDLKSPETQLDLRRPENPKKGKVDRAEHRKGMPVRDNLLE